MHFHQHLITPPVLDADEDIPIFPPDEGPNMQSSAMISYYYQDTGSEAMNMFPDLPIRSSSSSEAQQYSGNPNFLGNNTEISIATQPWSFNEIDLSVFSVMDNTITLNNEVECNAYSSYDIATPLSETQMPRRYDHQVQQHHQHHQQNTLEWNHIPKQDAFNAGSEANIFFPSPLSVGTRILETPPPTYTSIMLPVSSSSYSATSSKIGFLNSATNKSSQSQQQQQKKKGKVFCMICPKSFGRQQDLKRHQLTHSNERNFQCDICYFPFHRKDALDRHRKNLALKCRDRRHVRRSRGYGAHMKISHSTPT